MKTINIIGAGKLGLNLAFALKTQPDYSLQAICNRRLSSAQAAVKLLGEGQACAKLSALPSADITFITTPDALIASTAMTLAKEAPLKSQGVVVHMSGANSSEVLEPLKEKACFIASIHPLKAFANPETNAFNNVYCSVDGDDEAINALNTLFGHLGARLITISQDKKALYHSAAVYASNFAVTLHHLAYEQFIAAGIRDDDAKLMTSQLMLSAVANIDRASSHHAALTGPIKRKDTATIEKNRLAQLDDEQRQLFDELLKATKRKLTNKS